LQVEKPTIINSQTNHKGQYTQKNQATQSVLIVSLSQIHYISSLI